ncbi:hypothetical protein DRW07_00330 [Alteromonas sediminis]|uniref:Chalcone isomerase domain-containing protein n=1 Tax=Alteromonas sediminis TaxID=2259342 RepID=A0A3N5ZA34_9ALTE|nr:chalcone isomerase family protein [Alteromonas sediminis]RPJ67894.1 hypothetical protein DRW07_00330 [Alteromonas sediminis]
MMRLPTILMGLLISFGVLSMPQPVDEHIPQAKLVGEGKFTYLFWDVYNAQLFAPDGRWQAQAPYALTLTYLRNFDGEDIAVRSREEMEGLGFKDKEKLASWEQVMKDIFPDVQEGEQITGIIKADQTTVFYKNQELIGAVEDREFGEQFFAIWLHENTSEPRLRKKLIGEK